MRPLRTARPAIAMIELIFAIVVMGIVLLSAPMIIQTASQSSYVATQQEAISEAASRLSMILSYPWDERDTDPGFIPPILRVTNGDAGLNETGNTGRRFGTPQNSSRSFYRTDGQDFFATSAPNLGLDGNDNGTPDDMDDFDGQSALVQVENAPTADYIDTTVRLTTAVSYAADDPDNPDTYANPGADHTLVYTPFRIAPGAGNANQSTNIKQFTVTLTSTANVSELTKTITLRAFSCNIGGYEIKEKVF